MAEDRPDVASRDLLAAGLTALRRSADLEGAAVIELGADSGPTMVHVAGTGASEVLAAAGNFLALARGRASHGIAPDGRPVMVCPWPSAKGGLALWRASGSRGWAAGDRQLAVSAAALVRVMLDFGPGKLGLDPLTGLPNRRYFLTEVDRHIDRLDRDSQFGTMMLIDLDGLKGVNRMLGRAVGDRLLIRIGGLLRAMVRPGDIVGRVGGDEFAIWLSGMDHLTAAERAEDLVRRRIAADESADPATRNSRQTLSIGIAMRAVGCDPLSGGEDARALWRRAHMAAYDVKQGGGDGWKVSLIPPGTAARA